MEKNKLLLINSILTHYIPDHEVWAFGSRVNGNARRFSDLDLVIMDEVDDRTMALLRMDLSESDLPVRVDVMRWLDLNCSMQNSVNLAHEVLLRGNHA